MRLWLFRFSNTFGLLIFSRSFMLGFFGVGLTPLHLFFTEPRVHRWRDLQRTVHDRLSGLQDQSKHLPVQPAGGTEQFYRLLPPPGQAESCNKTGQLHSVRQPRERPGAGHPSPQNHVDPSTNVNADMFYGLCFHSFSHWDSARPPFHTSPCFWFALLPQTPNVMDPQGQTQRAKPTKAPK